MKFTLALAAFAFQSFAFAADPDVALEATYRVPVAPELEAYASFAIPHYKIGTNAQGQRTMEFSLPLDLSGGEGSPVVFALVSQGPELKKSFSGSSGSAECVGKWVELVCEFKFIGLPSDADRAARYLDQKYGPGTETEKRKVVAARFMSEPIGTGRTQPRGVACPGSHLGDGRWRIAFKTENGVRSNGVAEFEQGQVWIYEMRPVPQRIEITGLHYYGNRAAGIWKTQTSSGRVDFVLNDNGHEFAARFSSDLLGNHPVADAAGRR